MEPNKQLAVITPGAQYKNLSLNEAKELAGAMVNAKMFPDLESANTAYVKILAGQEMGVPPFQAMSGIHIIKGRATIAAALLASKIMESGRYKYDVIVMSDDVVVLNFYVMVSGKWVLRGESRFSKEDASKAGTQNMGRFPRNMLFSRALSNGYKWYAPDALNGVTAYVEGEIVDEPGAPEMTPEEIAAEEERAKEALNRGRRKMANAGQKGLKIKEDAPEPAQAPVESETDKTPPTEPEAPETAPNEPEQADGDEYDRMDLGELSKVADKLGIEGTGKLTADGLRKVIRNHKPGATQVEGDPTTYTNPLPMPAPKAETVTTEPVEEPFGDGPEGEMHTDGQRKKIMATLNEKGFTKDHEKRQVVAGILGLENIVSFKTVTFDQASRLIESLDDPTSTPDNLRQMFVTEGPANAATA